MKITHVKVYDLEDSVVASGFPMCAEYSESLYKGLQDNPAGLARIARLSDAKPSHGEDNALSGILVSFDVTGTVKWWTQCQRYHFIQIVSSMSTMHRLVSMLKEDKAQFHPAVDPRIIEILKDMLKQERPFEELVYSCPMGIELTARVSTNYLQLKTIYRQRRFHKLKEWRDFCDFMKRNLPYSFLFAKD